eukprot:COSAG01_NODE_29707_length_631_cov_2.640977_1_plen_24_part_10
MVGDPPSMRALYTVLQAEGVAITR